MVLVYKKFENIFYKMVKKLQVKKLLRHRLKDGNGKWSQFYKISHTFVSFTDNTDGPVVRTFTRVVRKVIGCTRSI